VNPLLPVATVPEFTAYAKTNPDKIAMGSGGNRSVAHVAGELFKLITGSNLAHVPYRGAAPAVTAARRPRLPICSAGKSR
jgi:tripartite-type tricarboxylate transporter receptor subunit TctC